jgi:hypothetical protein
MHAYKHIYTYTLDIQSWLGIAAISVYWIIFHIEMRGIPPSATHVIATVV